jgi:hypothetical protein
MCSRNLPACKSPELGSPLAKSAVIVLTSLLSMTGQSGDARGLAFTQLNPVSLPALPPGTFACGLLEVLAY